MLILRPVILINLKVIATIFYINIFRVSRGQEKITFFQVWKKKHWSGKIEKIAKSQENTRLQKWCRLFYQLFVHKSFLASWCVKTNKANKWTISFGMTCNQCIIAAAAALALHKYWWCRLRHNNSVACKHSDSCCSAVKVLESLVSSVSLYIDIFV